MRSISSWFRRRNGAKEGDIFASPKGTVAQRLTRGIFISVFGSFLLAISSMLLAPIYTRILTPSDYGILGSLTPMLSLLERIINMMTIGAVMYYFIQMREKPDDLRVMLGTQWIITWLCAALVGILFIFTGPWLFRLVFNDVTFPFFKYGIPMLMYLIISPASYMLEGLYRAREARVQIAVLGNVTFFVQFGLMVWFLVGLGMGAAGQIWAKAITLLVLAVPAILLTLPYLTLKFNSVFARLSFSYSLPIMPNTFTAWMLNLSDRFFVVHFSGLAQAGLYSFGYTCGTAMLAVVSSLQGVWGPVYLDAAKNRSDASQILGRQVNAWSLLLCYIAASGILLAPEIVHIIANERYWPSVPYIGPVILGYLLSGLYTFPALAFQHTRKNGTLSIFKIISASANIGLNFWLVPLYGALAAAWNTAISFGLLMVLVYIFGLRLIPLKINWVQWSGSLLLVFLAIPASSWAWAGPTGLFKLLVIALAGIGVVFRLGGPKRLLGMLNLSRKIS